MRRPPLEIIAQARKITDAVLIGLSGGKDSLCCLHLCHQLKFKRIAAYFLFLVPHLTFQERMLRYCEKRYGITVYRLPHWGLSHLLSEEIFRGPYQGDDDIPKLMLRDVEDEARKLSGIEWIATGQRKDDSLERRAMLTRCQGINVRTRHFYPISEWGHRHVYSFLRQQKIPLSFGYRYATRSLGCRLHPDDLRAIKQECPEDYAKIEKRFPYVGSLLARQQIIEDRAKDDKIANAGQS